MFTTKNIYRNIWLLHLIVWLGVFSACTEIDDEPAMVKTRSLTMSRIAIADNVNVQTARVLVFDESGALVTNVGPISNLVQDANNDNILNINATNGTDKILAKVGKNSVYVVLNEADNISNYNLTERLEGITAKSDLLDLLKEPINYNNLIPVGDTEPPFLMCVYDDNVNVTNQTEILDLTGLKEYGFPMRRSMAKIVLESIIGGVKPDGKIVGTEEIYNPEAIGDQTGNSDECTINNGGLMVGDDNAIALALTNEILIQKVELLNVPTKYYLNQDATEYNSLNGYLSAIITEGMTNNLGYINRDWKGSITTDGTVDFTRTDALPALWKHAKNSSSYGFEERYPFSEPWDTENWSTNGPYYLNSGEFVQYIQEAYGENGNLEFEEGPIVPHNLQLTSILNPGVWTINTNIGYYIPENIQPEENSKYTSLRVYYTIGSIMANVTEDEIEDAIHSALDNNKVPIVGEDGKTLVINKNDNWQAEGVTYIRNRGHFIQNPTKLRDGKNSKDELVGESNDIEWGIKYDGIETIWTGTGVVISDRPGYYFADQTYQTYSIDIPLNNDEYKNGKGDENNWQYDTDTDNNIYRGREYHVKLYVTKQGAWNNQTNTASRTINIGGEELTITGKVVTTPMK